MLPELRAKAEAGDPKAQCDLGSVYAFSRFGIPQSWNEAMKWFRKSAEQNYAEAECRLGTGYQFGVGLNVDCEEALKWYRKSAEQNFAEAYWRLATDSCGEKRITTAITNDVQRFQLFLKAAELGAACGYDDLGRCYYHGSGVEKDLVEAYKWYSMAGIKWDHYEESVKFMAELKSQLTPDFT